MNDLTLMTISWLLSSAAVCIFTGILDTFVAITLLALFVYSFLHWIV